MHVDDRLSTVLRQQVASERAARTQFRQLVDLLDQQGGADVGALSDSGWERLSTLSALIPARDRATILREEGWRLRNPVLVMFLAEQEPDVAASALSVADLPAAEWTALVPQLPIRARGFLRLRRDLPEAVRDLLERLGIHDRALPAPGVNASATDAARTADADNPLLLEDAVEDTAPSPTSLSAASTGMDRAPTDNVQSEAGPVRPGSPVSAEPSAGPSSASASDDPIGSLVRRIEEFQAQRRATRVPADITDAGMSSSPRPTEPDAPPEAAARCRAFLFSTDARGLVEWADGDVTPAVAGTSLFDVLRGAGDEGDALTRFGLHLPVSPVAVHLEGADQISGEWIVEAVPRFDRPDGRYAGHHGRFTRPGAAAPMVDARAEHADRLRQVLHELRTPVNAIQGYAEFIQQELVGPAPHTYRALAAAIAGDGARILSGFDELDRLARLESGTRGLSPGTAQLADVLSATVRQLRPVLQQRRAGFDLTIRVDDAAVPLAGPDAELLMWRVLAAAATGMAEGEIVELDLRSRDGSMILSYGLPAALRDTPDLFATTFRLDDDPVSASVFGTGFALRLARAEASVAGGQLRVADGRMILTLPAVARNGDGRQAA